MYDLLGDFGLLPPEMIANVCEFLTLDEICALQETNEHLELIIDNVFFVNLKKMRITCDEKGAMLTLSARRSHSYIGDAAYSISSDSAHWDTVIAKSVRVTSLTLSLPNNCHDFRFLKAINRAGIRITKFTLNVDCLEKQCNRTANRCHRKLSCFVEQQSACMASMKVSTSPTSSIHFDATVKDHIRLEYAHKMDTLMHQSLIYPLFNAFNVYKAGPSSAELHVDWEDRLDLALQSAFMAALPWTHRSKLKSLKLGFGSKISTLTRDEIHDTLRVFSSSLQDAVNLKELHCDFTTSKLNPCDLEKTIVMISGELTSVHRIRLLTDPPEFPTDADIRKEWQHLPQVY